MNLNDIQSGMKVKTIPELKSTKGMWIAKKHLDERCPNVEGVVLGYVPGHGGDVWWVRHNELEIAAYCFDEFDEVGQ